MLSATGLTKRYPTAGQPLTVLEDTALELAANDAVVVTGPSGCGKSTLLYLLGAIEQPTAGTIKLGETNPFSLGEAERARFRNEQVGFVFQDHHLLPQCTVLENVLVPLLASRKATAADETRAKELLGSVGLAERLTHRPAALSGGERQRTAFCRALINEPALLLADEPTGNLDPATAATIGDLLLNLSGETGTMLVCVTHSMELAKRFPRWCELTDRKLVERSTTPGNNHASESTTAAAANSLDAT